MVLVLTLAVAGLANAGIWDAKPFMKWTWCEAARVLDASPWVSELETRCGPPRRYWGQVASFLNPLTLPGVQKYRNQDTPILQERISARLLTARPVREAYLRLLSLAPVQTGGVSLAQLRQECSPDSDQLRLDSFVSANPDDLRVRGSDAYIILSITETQRSYLYNPNINIIGVVEFLNREAHPDGFGNLELAALQPVTCLSTRTKSVRLVRYERPGPDNLGAKFYFPRFLPDGNPFVTSEDKELQFESVIDKITITATFDLKRLQWQGRLEF
jgi:hypothetical protein